MHLGCVGVRRPRGELSPALRPSAITDLSGVCCVCSFSLRRQHQASACLHPDFSHLSPSDDFFTAPREFFMGDVQLILFIGCRGPYSDDVDCENTVNLLRGTKI